MLVVVLVVLVVLHTGVPLAVPVGVEMPFRPSGRALADAAAKAAGAG